VGEGPPPCLGCPDPGARLSPLVDTNFLIRHLTGEPAELGERATRFLAGAQELLIAGVVVADCVYVLESFYEVERPRVAQLMRSALDLRSVRVAGADLLRRALELYELTDLHFVDAYLAATAEVYGQAIASFDRGFDRVPTIRRIEP
jgi:predicted nucleic acid-binding protein